MRRKRSFFIENQVEVEKNRLRLRLRLRKLKPKKQVKVAVEVEKGLCSYLTLTSTLTCFFCSSRT
jgi:hypothetical protein